MDAGKRYRAKASSRLSYQAFYIEAVVSDILFFRIWFSNNLSASKLFLIAPTSESSFSVTSSSESYLATSDGWLEVSDVWVVGSMNVYTEKVLT
jgi:hypothetical protein